MITQQITAWSIPVIVFSVATVLAFAVRHVVLRVLRRRAPLYVAEAVAFPSMLWGLALGLELAIRNSQAPPAVEYWAGKAIGAFVIVSIGLAAAAIAVRLLASYGERNKLHFAVAGLSRTLIYIFVLSIALLTLLSEFGVRITPILTALGVGGLAVALALQDTLANFFAGIHILVEEPVMVGDFIELSEKERGTVVDIGWRTTRILTGANTVIVIPNQKITSGILTNYNMPTPMVSAEVVLNVAHGADVAKLWAIALEAAAKTEGVLPEPAPVLAFDPGVLPTHLSVKLVVHVATAMDRGPVQSMLRRRIYEDFMRGGIAFPEVRS